MNIYPKTEHLRTIIYSLWSEGYSIRDLGRVNAFGLIEQIKDGEDLTKVERRAIDWVEEEMRITQCDYMSEMSNVGRIREY